MSKEREEFFYAMGREGLPIGIARAIARDARRLDSLAVRQCNEPWSDVLEARVERARARITAALPKGWKAIFGRDPRGPAVKLLPPSGRTNDWGNEGICVA